MAQKKPVKQKKPAAPVESPVRAEPQTLASLRQECERLRVELAASRSEVADLRGRQEQVLNRIDWVLDSLDSLTRLDN